MARDGRRIVLSLPVLLLPLALLAACGSSGSPKAATKSATTVAHTLNTAVGYVNGKSSKTVVKSAKVASLGAVLVSSRGRTLYHLTTEKTGQIKCTNSCAAVWPPLIASSKPSKQGLPGTLATVKRPDGKTQVTYNGMPLYLYSGDTAAGQANGQGFHGIWYVVKPGSSPNSGSSGNGY